MPWIRTCQECLHQQEDNKPPEGELSDIYSNRKCRVCKSMALDYGKEGLTPLQASIVDNLRRTFGDKLKDYSDISIYQEYIDFGQSDMTGSNDARFLEWLGLEERK